MSKFGIRKRQQIGEAAVKIVEKQLIKTNCKIRNTGCEKRLSKTLLAKLRYRKQPKDYLLRYRPDKLVTNKKGKQFYLEIKSSYSTKTFISYTQFIWNYFHNKIHPVYYVFVDRKKQAIKICKYEDIKIRKIYIFKCRKYKYYAQKDKNIILVANNFHKFKFGKSRDFVKESLWEYTPKPKWFNYKGIFVEIDVCSCKRKMP